MHVDRRTFCKYCAAGGFGLYPALSLAAHLNGGAPLAGVEVPEMADLGAGRVVLISTKVRPTPSRYPRRPGLPAKEPLSCSLPSLWLDGHPPREVTLRAVDARHSKRFALAFSSLLTMEPPAKSCGEVTARAPSGCDTPPPRSDRASRRRSCRRRAKALPAGRIGCKSPGIAAPCRGEDHGRRTAPSAAPR